MAKSKLFPGKLYQLQNTATSFRCGGQFFLYRGHYEDIYKLSGHSTIFKDGTIVLCVETRETIGKNVFLIDGQFYNPMVGLMDNVEKFFKQVAP